MTRDNHYDNLAQEYMDLLERNQALRAKLKSVQRSAKEYKRSRDFDMYDALHGAAEEAWIEKEEWEGRAKEAEIQLGYLRRIVKEQGSLIGHLRRARRRNAAAAVKGRSESECQEVAGLPPDGSYLPPPPQISP